jgi:hypothetical protein
MNRLQAGECLVHREEIRLSVRRDDHRVLERYFRDVATAALVVTGARRIHEDPAHRPRGHREEMRPVLPAHLTDVDQPQVRFVDQRGGLKGVAGPLACHVMPGEAVQLVMDERNEPIECTPIAAAPGQEKCRWRGRIGRNAAILPPAHCNGCYEKLDVHSKAAAVTKALRSRTIL